MNIDLSIVECSFAAWAGPCRKRCGSRANFFQVSKLRSRIANCSGFFNGSPDGASVENKERFEVGF